MATIQTYCRIKPTKQLYEDYDTTNNTLNVRTSDSYRDFSAQKQAINAVNHEFTFSQVFRDQATQDEVFDVVAKDIVNHFLTGYNGTIFAYGQTGTGKTFTVEGSARRYQDRGLAPRALSMVYKELEGRPEEEEFSVHLSYIEIYQETAYDLLNPAATRNHSLVTPFPKVNVIEGPKGSCVFRNLSTHLAANEDVAQSLLLQGQANRKVAETPMNQRSSRSHAVFTIQLKAKKPGSDVITYSKLHLVDLAGSERVGKTGVNGLQLTEAKYINLSLHHLEGVIIALHRESQRKSQSRTPSAAVAQRRHAPYPRVYRSKTVPSFTASSVRRPATSDGFSRNSKHIPYRNSVLTMVLRDSLGGNCLTAMIATISMEMYNLGESLSTCRFAQRVACIANNARRNEEVDDKSMIKRLKARISELEVELAQLKYSGHSSDGVDASVTLTDEDKLKCADMVKKFVAGVITDPLLAGITDPFKFRECMTLLKNLIGSTKDGSARPVSSGNLSAISSATSGFDEPEAAKNRPETTGSIPSIAQDVEIQMAPPSKVDLDSGDPYGWSANSPTVAWGAGKPANPNPTKPFSFTSTPGPGKHNSANRSPFTSTPEFKGSGLRAREAFKSPFEKKREKDVQKLNTKVEKIYANQLEEQQHLIEFQTSVKEQQLELIENELEGNIRRSKDQLANQHAYVLSLKRNEADPELIDQEKLVERQLRKREHKLYKRLKIIQEQKALIQQHYQQEKVGAPNPGTDIGDKFSEYVNRDGKINVRQVKQILEQQEKQQQQYQKKIERQRIMAVSKQLEVKEMSTKQKLLEFKEKLRMSQSGQSPNTSLFSNLGDSNQETPKPGWSSKVNNSSENPLKIEDFDNGPAGDSTEIKPKYSTVNHGTTAMNWDMPSFQGKSVQTRDVFESSPERYLNTQSAAMQNNFFKDVRKSPRNMHDNITSPRIMHDNITSPRIVHDNITSPRIMPDNRRSPRDPQDNITSPRLMHRSDEAGIMATPAYSSPLFNALHGDKKSRKSRSRHREKESKRKDHESKKSSIFVSEPSANLTKHEQSGAIYSTGSAWRNDSATSFPNGKGASKESSSRSHKHEPKFVKEKSEDDNLLEQFMPSEYVNQRTSGKFDGRRMGLSTKSFDSALSNMLGERSGAVNQEHYDKHARTTKMKVSQERSSEENLSKQLNKGPSYDAKKHRIEISTSETKDDRSSRDKKMKSQRNKENNRSPRGKEKHTQEVIPKEIPKQSPQEFIVPKKSLFHKPTFSQGDDEVGVKPSKITALKDTQREETYMSTAQQQKQRVLKIRQAVCAAEVIQRAWHRFKARGK